MLYFSLDDTIFSAEQYQNKKNIEFGRTKSFICKRVKKYSKSKNCFYKNLYQDNSFYYSPLGFVSEGVNKEQLCL